jgi:hypothetical protein
MSLSVSSGEQLEDEVDAIGEAVNLLARRRYQLAPKLQRGLLSAAFSLTVFGHV